MNVRSLRHKIQQIHEILHDHEIHILSIKETHLDGSVSDHLLHIPGYSIYRKDRSLHGGGVCLYVSSSLKATVVHASSHPELEALHILVRPGKNTRAEKFIVSTVYKPPSTGVDFWDYLSAQLDSQPVPKSKRIILGDFNTNAIPPHSPQLKYLNRANSVQSTVCTLITVPTRLPSNTCLDLVLLEAGLCHEQPSVTAVDDLSDHHLVVFDLHLHSWHRTQKHTYRSIRKPGIVAIEFRKFKEDARALLAVNYNDATIDLQAETFLTSLADLTNPHAPVQLVRFFSTKSTHLQTLG